MEKPAPIRYPINELIQRRWSPRAFADRPVEPQLLHSLFEAARWAASSYNEQPWGFILAHKHDAEEFEPIADCLIEANVWAAEAPILMITLAKLTLDRNDKANRHAYHDLGQAVANLLIQATDLGLFVHQMGGFSQDKARENLRIPNSWDPVAGLALGYPGDPEDLIPELRDKEFEPRSRRDFEEFVFQGVFGEPMPFKSRVARALQGD